MSHNVHSAQPSTRPRRCPCPQPGHRHGCATRYSYLRCRCPHCTKAHNRQANLRRTTTFKNPCIPSIGTARRLQALAVAGWSCQEIADRLGLKWHVGIQQLRAPDRPTVEARTAKRISALYDELWDELPPHSTANHVRAYAARKQWVPALAWDDIDDPHARPQGLTKGDLVGYVDPVVVARLVAGQPAEASRPEVNAAIIRLTELGYSGQEIQARIAIPISTRWVTRARARARLEVAA